MPRLDAHESILRDGLKANEEGYIYLFTDMIVANSIVRDQVFTNRFTVFLIDRKGLSLLGRGVSGEQDRAMMGRLTM